MDRFKSVRRRSAADLLLSGAGSIGLDQAIRLSQVEFWQGGIASDWQAVGDDLRRAMRRAGDGAEAA